MNHNYHVTDEVFTLEGRTFKVTLFTDDDAESPREWEPNGTMVFDEHRQYTFPAENSTIATADEVREWMLEYGFKGTKARLQKRGARGVLPIYVMDHSGLSVQTVPFGCPWDSGLHGVVYQTLDSMKGKKAAQCSDAEVEAYHQYLSGDVYVIHVVEGSEDEDGDWSDKEDGFEEYLGGVFGHDESLEAGKEMAQHVVNTDKE